MMMNIEMKYHYEICDAQDRSIASLIVHRKPNPSGGNTLWVSSVWVHGEHRGKGLARALSETMLREWGHETLYTHVVPFTDGAVDAATLADLYARAGFQPTAVPGIMVRYPNV
jgi:GNAT superfamily N-acetyltransferase